MRFLVAGKNVNVSAKDTIGKGGEADVYALKDGSALKVFKGPQDPDYANDANAQEGARRRLLEQQAKLPAFPSNLPPNVVAPRELATNETGKIAGYTMDYLQGCEVLLRYADKRFREQGGVDPNKVVSLMENLADVVDQLHHDRVVVGDFNDLNVLVASDQSKVYMIDADSFQYGSFLCRTFTPRFLDPLCSRDYKLELASSLSQESDWYAFAVMLFQCLLYVGPYGGVYRPKLGARLQHDQRVLHRVTVFDADVIYPKPALPYNLLPDNILDYFDGVFRRDERGKFPPVLLQDLRWTTCTNCGATHARSSCPACQTYVKKEPVVVRGNVKAQRVFWTEGTIVATAYQSRLRYVYHNGREFVRENGSLVASGQLHPELRYRIWGNGTVIGRRNLTYSYPGGERSDVDSYGHLPAFDANSSSQYWISQEGQLRSVAYGATFANMIGDVLTGRTLFWVGEKFGFGFYRAGDLIRAFVFTDKGMNDQVPIPGFRGELVDSTCAFSDQRVWFFATLQEKGKLRNYVYVVSSSGALVGSRNVLQTEDDWLSTGIRGRFAAGSLLYVPTDEGIVRVDEALSVEKRFPDTEPFVDATSYLLAGDGGIYVVKSNEITLLRIS